MPRGVNDFDTGRIQGRNAGDANSSNIVSPGIVTDGLVLHLDAGNYQSYPIAGTTLYDLSGRGNNGTLTNGPTYVRDGGGAIDFDSTNDYLEVSTRNTDLEFQPLQPYSVFCWCYNLSSASTGSIISNMSNSSPFQGWDLWVNNSSTIAAHLISSWSGNAVKVLVSFDYSSNSNKWIYVGYTYNGTSPSNSTASLNSMNFYLNSKLLTSGKAVETGDGFDTTSEIITYNTSQRLRITGRWASGARASGIPLTMSNTQIYNRELSEPEIAQNFNATRARFNI